MDVILLVCSGLASVQCAVVLGLVSVGFLFMLNVFL